MPHIIKVPDSIPEADLCLHVSLSLPPHTSCSSLHKIEILQPTHASDLFPQFNLDTFVPRDEGSQSQKLEASPAV